MWLLCASCTKNLSFMKLWLYARTNPYSIIIQWIILHRFFQYLHVVRLITCTSMYLHINIPRYSYYVRDNLKILQYIYIAEKEFFPPCNITMSRKFIKCICCGDNWTIVVFELLIIMEFWTVS